MLGLAETATLGAFLAQDLLLFVLFFDLMLVPFWFLIGTFGGENRVAATTKMIVYTLVGSLLMLVAAIATAILAQDQIGHLTFSIAELRVPRASERQPVLDLLLLRRGLPDQDAGLPGPRLDAGRLPRRAAAGPGAALGRPVQGRRLRVPAGRAAALPAGHRPVSGADPGDRSRRDPLRLGDGLHADQRPPDRRLLVDRAARLHHDRDLLAACRRRRRRRPADGQPRARRRRHLPDRRAAGRAGGQRGPVAARRPRDARPGPRRALPDRRRWRPWRCRARPTSSASSTS